MTRDPVESLVLVMLDAFEALFRASAAGVALLRESRRLPDGRHDPDTMPISLISRLASDHHRRALLASTDRWQPPGNIGWCVWTAIRDGGIESTRLDQILAPYWPTLWGLAARGHWIRHDGQPVRTSGANDEDMRRRVILPNPLRSGDLTLSCASADDTELGLQIDFGARRICWLIHRYPELMEFRAMLDAPDDQSWRGRHFAAMSTDTAQEGCGAWLTPEARIDVSTSEWAALRDLVQRVWQSPDFQRWIHERWLEYGEHG